MAQLRLATIVLETLVPQAARKALLVINRHARNGYPVPDGALDRLRAGGIDLMEADPLDVAVSIDNARASGCNCVVIGGGDGTLNRAAAALSRTDLPLGILPLGTANDLARSLAIPASPIEAASIIVEGHHRPIDLGEVNGTPFFNVASIGFSADLARELTADAKKRFGTFGYALAGLRILARMRPFTVTIEHDGKREVIRTVQVSVGNGRHYGGGLTIDLDARPDDGLLHVYSLGVERWWQLLALLPALKQGTQGRWREVSTFTTTACTVETRRPRSINTDGELTGKTPASFHVIPGAVEVYTRPPA
ncbi:putative Diacylglycerol kinase [Hyphomicrobiales bacterium]|nr:putative Diacylglycerol kinase [Hyphomicrobiales bacterium]CAH1668333.1 putative Diacylglycerol kinase [Hyphomicrobiales bacterium]